MGMGRLKELVQVEMEEVDFTEKVSELRFYVVGDG